MPRKRKLSLQELEAVEAEMVELIAIGQTPPGTELFMQPPELARKLEARKAELRSEARRSRSQNRALTRHVLSASGMASVTISNSLGQSAKGVSQETLQSEIPVLMERLKQGDGSMLEEMLLGQSLQLQAIATTLLSQGAVAQSLDARQPLTNLGLKASNQLRQVLATLNDVRNPRRAVFIRRQLNQLNLENSKNSQKSANELLAATNGSTTLDKPTEAETGRTNQEMATLATFERAENNAGEASQLS